MITELGDTRTKIRSNSGKEQAVNATAVFWSPRYHLQHWIVVQLYLTRGLTSIHTIDMQSHKDAARPYVWWIRKSRAGRSMSMTSWKRTKRQVTMRAQRIKISNDAPRGIELRNSYAWQLKNEIDGERRSAATYVLPCRHEGRSIVLETRHICTLSWTESEFNNLV